MLLRIVILICFFCANAQLAGAQENKCAANDNTWHKATRVTVHYSYGSHLEQVGKHLKNDSPWDTFWHYKKADSGWILFLAKNYPERILLLSYKGKRNPKVVVIEAFANNSSAMTQIREILKKKKFPKLPKLGEKNEN